MLALVATQSTGNYKAYIWQLSHEGYNYELEILNNSGCTWHKEIILESFEEVKEKMLEYLTVAEKAVTIEDFRNYL